MRRRRRFPAVILATARFGEIHRSVQLLNDEDELIRAVAHGAASAKGKLRGKTDQLTRGICYLYTEPVKGYSKVTDFDPAEYYPGIKGHLEAFYTACLWAELILKSLAGGGQAEEVYPLLVESLDGLEAALVAPPTTPAAGTGAARPGVPAAEPGAARLFNIRFLWRYLEILGVQPDLDECAACGRKIEEREERFLRPASGELVCAACAGENALALPGAGALRHLAAAEPAALARISVDPETARRIASVLIVLTESTLGASLESRRSGRSVLGL